MLSIEIMKCSALEINCILVFIYIFKQTFFLSFFLFVFTNTSISDCVRLGCNNAWRDAAKEKKIEIIELILFCYWSFAELPTCATWVLIFARCSLRWQRTHSLRGGSVKCVIRCIDSSALNSPRASNILDGCISLIIYLFVYLFIFEIKIDWPPL